MTNPTPDNIDSVMRRVQKLLAMAQDGRGDQNEAAAAAQMAEKIMRKYQIDHQDVIVNDLKTGGNLSTSDHVAYTGVGALPKGHKAVTVPVWCNWIAVSVAAFLDCGARIVDTPGGKRVRFYGLKQDVLVCGWMFDYLLSTTRALVEQFRKQGGTVTKDGGVASYRRGVALGITSKLQEMTTEKEAEVEAEQVKIGTGSSLMLLKREAVEQKYGLVYSTKTKVVKFRNADAYSTGQAHGKSVDMNVRGVAATKSNLLQIGKN